MRISLTGFSGSALASLKSRQMSPSLPRHELADAPNLSRHHRLVVTMTTVTMSLATSGLRNPIRSHGEMIASAIRKAGKVDIDSLRIHTAALITFDTSFKSFIESLAWLKFGGHKCRSCYP